ncbi:hypothetical protein MC45_11440 [Sphingomonas taxi]|uniref:Uncharacterized protein n=1 Tax=Sphingomonas taxi TaxID=1549858 RepID=A0A097EH34_9SPHN|nr:hypothetical protein [Sphingomonas taxi]AIT06885.1 hypothetical protein MC45_11440 [Sphingomonas taxi]
MSAILRTAVLCAIVTGAASPALAAKKPPVVIVPARVIADPAARICMPRSTSPLIAKDKSLPETICETVAAWAAHGVTIRAK